MTQMKPNTLANTFHTIVPQGTETMKALEYLMQCKNFGDALVIPYKNPFKDSPETFTRQVGGSVEEFEYMRIRLLRATKPTDIKYLSPKDSPVFLYFSSLINSAQWQEYALLKNVPLVFVEGEKKADYLTRFFPHILPIGIAGVWQWAAAKEDQHELNLRASLKTHRIDAKNPNITKEQLEGWHVVKYFGKLLGKEKDKYSTDLLARLSDDYSRYFNSPLEQSTYALETIVDLIQQDISEKVHRLDQKRIMGLFEESLESLKSVGTQKCLHKDLLNNFKINNRDILICFDSDLDRLAPRVNDGYAHNSLMHALTELSQALAREGAKPSIVPIPKPPIGEKRYGIDDFAMHYSDDAVWELLQISLGFKAELGLILNPDRPKSLNSGLTQQYKVINPKPFSSLLSANLAGIILKHYLKVVYRNNKGWYKFNGTHWEYLAGEDTEIQKILYECLKSQPELTQTIKAKEVAPFASIDESQWNKGESQGTVLLKNGTLNLVTSKFTPLEDIPNIAEEYFTQQLQVVYESPSKDSLQRLRKFLGHYVDNQEELRYLLAMAYWLLFPKQYFISNKKKFPVEKMFYLVGSQGTGKSTFLEFLTRTIASSKVAEISPDNLDSVTGIGNYIDATLWKSNDFSGNVSKEAIETLNKVISGEALEGRKLYRQSEMRVIAASVILAGNDTLSFPQKGTQGILRRIVYIPFNKPVKSYDYSVIDYTSSEEAVNTFFWLITQLNLQDAVNILNSSQCLPSKYAQFTTTVQETNDTVTDFFINDIVLRNSNEDFLSGSQAVCGDINMKYYRDTLFKAYLIYCQDNGISNHFTAHKLEKLLREKNLIKFKGFYPNGEPVKHKGKYVYVINTDALQNYSVDTLRLVSSEAVNISPQLSDTISNFFQMT